MKLDTDKERAMTPEFIEQQRPLFEAEFAEKYMKGCPFNFGGLDVDRNYFADWVQDRFDGWLLARSAGLSQEPVPVVGQEISVDVSTGDDDAGRRIFARLTGEMVGDVWLAEATEDNAAPQHPAPAVGADAVEALMIDRRIGVYPEYEGQWHAQIYGDDETVNFRGEGKTPRDAINAAIALQAGEQS